MYWGLAGTLVTQVPKGHIGGIGLLGSVGAILGHQGVSGVYWGLAGTLGTQGPEGYRGIRGNLGAPMGCRGLFLGSLGV